MSNKLDTTSTEELGIDVLNPIFGYSKTIAPHLKKRDKYPIWDGELMLYKEGGKNKNPNLIGPVPAQVKSTCNKNVPISTVKRKIKVEELKTFQKNGGIAYFVVYVHPTDFKKSKVFYSLLTPVDLVRYITMANSQKTISVELQELKELDLQKELSFLDFYNDCNKQRNFVSPIFLRDIEKEIDSIKIDFSLASCKDKIDFFKYLTTHENFIYVTFKGDPTKTPHPLGDSRYKLKTMQEADVPISVSDKVYFEKCIAEIDNGNLFITVKDVMSFPFPMEITNEPFIGKVNFNAKFRTLYQKINVLEFLIAAIKAKSFCVGETTMKVDDIRDTELSNLESELKQANNLKKTLELLNVKEDLDVSSLSNRETRDIKTLIDYFIYNDTTELSDEQLPRFAKIDISNISVLLFMDKDKDGIIRLSNGYDLSSFVFYTEDDDKSKVIIPPYAAYGKAVFRDANNINYTDILKTFENSKCNNSRFFQAANWTVLRMLMGYDEQKQKNDELLKAALDLTTWLEGIDKETRYVHVVNRLQIVKRSRELNQEEENILHGFIEQEGNNNELKFASYLLLGDMKSAKRCFSKLDNAVQELYKKELPIYNLIKNELEYGKTENANH